MLFLLVILNRMQPEAQAFGFKADSHLCVCEAAGGSTWCFTYDMSCGYQNAVDLLEFQRREAGMPPASSSCSHDLQEIQINTFLGGLTLN